MSGYFDLNRVIAIILGGGDANRFEPLSRYRAKGAMPILANHRLIDFPLSNLINSNIKRIKMTVQSNSHSLTKHTKAFSDSGISSMTEEYIDPVSPIRKLGFFETDADSLLAVDKTVWHDFDLEEEFDYAVIMMSDQILKIDIRQILHNLTAEIDMVMVHTEVPKSEAANKLGVLTFDDNDVIKNGEEILFKKVASLHEKLFDPPESRSGYCSANLQLLVVKISALKKLIEYIGEDPKSKLSERALPKMIANVELNIYGYDLNTCVIGGERFPGFIDVESPDTLHSFSMRMCDTIPPFNAHHKAWKIYTTPRAAMAGKFGRVKKMTNIMTGFNLIIEDDCLLDYSVISKNCIIRKGTFIKDSIINGGCVIGPGCHIENAIIDKDIKLPAGTVITPETKLEGLVKYDDFVEAAKQQRDIEAAPVITPNGIIVVPKGYKLN